MIHGLPPHSLHLPPSILAATARVLAGALVTVALGTNAALAGELSFSQQVIDERPLASDRTNDIAVADIDGDGKLDIWLSGRDGRGHQAAWYRNPGERGGPWKRYPFAEGSWKYGDLGDLDGDGDIDLAAGYDLEKRLYWAENTGIPEHAPWPKHFLGVTGAPDQVIVRDLDGDGKVEVVALFKNGPIHILRRPPDARQLWLRTVIRDVPRGTAGGSVGDVDNDGDLDIVFGNAWYENPGPAGDWTDGDRWKRRVVDARWPAESRSAVADIDGDGKNDLVLCAEESGEGAAWYRAGEGGASAGGWTATPINRRPYEKLHSCQVADFDGDGKADVFVAEMHTSDARRVTVFLQGKDPSDWIEKIVATTGSHNARVADIDGNGVPDIVGKNFEEDMRPRVWFAERGKSRLSLDDWKPHVLARRLPHQATFVRTADVNGDGRTDILAGAWWWENPGAIGGEWKQHELGGGLKNVAVVHDFDGDGAPDALGTDGAVRGGQFFLAQNRGGRFDVRKVGPASRGDFLQGAVVGSLDGEGTQVVLSWHNGDRVSPKIGTEWLLVPKTVTEEWKLAQLSEVTNEEEIALGDIDGDGRTDIHLGIHWLRNLGGGKFERRDGANLGEGEGDVDRLRLADVDGDGDLDVVIGLEHGNRLVWAQNRNNGAEWVVHAVAADFRHMSLDVRDIDGDGDVDVVSGAHKGRGEVTVYENLGRGARWQPHVVSAGASGIDHHAGTQLVDLDGDGDLDIVSIGWRNTSLTVYENLAIGGPRDD